MPTRKKATKTTKKSAKKGGKKSSKSRSRGRAMSGPVPPYAEAIRGAVARGDTQKMRDLAASSRKWVNDVQLALEELERAITESEA